MCGTLRKEELSYLFPDAGEMGSAALMPLSNGAQLGLIAVGSSDANRYTANGHPVPVTYRRCDGATVAAPAHGDR